MSRAGKHRKDGTPPADLRAGQEAIESNIEASKVLSEARARQDEVTTLVTALQRIREQNHFGDLIRAALGSTHANRQDR